MPKEPSILGASIETELARSFARERSPIQYLCTFRTPSGTVFAAERVTKGHINLWIPVQEAAQREAENSGLSIAKSIPWPDGPFGNYGRISSLKSIPSLVQSRLLKIQVTTAAEAMKIAEAIA